ncbi:MAG: hypothetical protein ABIQ95_12035 [Bdellovibrionia bacterium]
MLNQATLRKTNRYDYWITFALLLIILIMRSSNRILDPVIWAEDSIYISGILQHGFMDIFKAQFGYYQSLQRFICWCVMLFPVKLWPLLLTSTCYVIYAAVFSEFSKADYEAIIPSRLHRILACTVFAFLPGTNEILGNTPNLGWVLTAYVGIICLKKLGQKPSLMEIGFSAACMAGAGQTSIMIPLLLYRLYLTRTSTKIFPLKLPSVEFQRYLALLIIQFVFIYLNYLARAGNAQYITQLPSIPEVAKAWFIGTMNGMILQPILGTHWTHVVGKSAQPVAWVIALSTAIATTFLFFKLEKSKRLGIAFVLSWSSAIILCSVVRGWGNLYYSSLVFIEDSRARSSFVLGAGAIFLCFSLVPHLKWKGKPLSRIGIPIYCLWYFILNGAGDNFFIDSFRGPSEAIEIRSETKWSNHYGILEKAMKTGCPDNVEVQVEPPGWQVKYQGPQGSDCQLGPINSAL